MPKNLLLADDSITIQKVVGITFAQEDYDITYVDNGEDAIRKAREINPDIILADIIMPQKNGYEVCETIKKDATLSSTPVLLLAGTFETFDETRGKNAGADGYIIKPFESQALIDKVNELVTRKAQPKATVQTVAPQIPVQRVTPQPVSPPQKVISQQTQPAQPLKSVFSEPSVMPQKPPLAPKPVSPRIDEVPMPDLVTITPEPIVLAPDFPEITTPPSDPPLMDRRIEPMLEKEFPSPDLSQPGPKDEIPDSIDLSLSDPGSSQSLDLASPADFIMDTTSPPVDINPSPLAFEKEPPVSASIPDKMEDLIEVEKPPTFDFVSGESDLSPEPPKSDDTDFASFPDLGEPISPERFSRQSESYPGMDEMNFKDTAPEKDIEQIPTEMDVRTAVEKSDEVTSAAPNETEASEPSRIPDDQMEELVKRISQNIIEKIAWEVVPDMAERIIKEEIKRLTEEDKK